MSEPTGLAPEDAAFFRALRAAYPNGVPADEWYRIFVGPPQPGFEDALRHLREALATEDGPPLCEKPIALAPGVTLTCHAPKGHSGPCWASR